MQSLYLKLFDFLFYMQILLISYLSGVLRCPIFCFFKHLLNAQPILNYLTYKTFTKMIELYKEYVSEKITFMVFFAKDEETYPPPLIFIESLKKHN